MGTGPLTNAGAASRRRAFTLVEMLTVIVIIGILAGLISVAAARALHRTRVMLIKNEVSQLATAMEAFKSRFGDYPPDFTEESLAGAAPYPVLQRFFAKAFPRYTNGANWKTDLQNAVLDPSTGSPDPNFANYVNELVTTQGRAAALMFWLGGIPEYAIDPATNTYATDANGAYILKGFRGFSANPRNPFDASSPARIAPFFEFDVHRVRALSPTSPCSALFYVQPGTEVSQSEPYVYFRSLGTSAYYRDDSDGDGIRDATPASWTFTRAGVGNVTVTACFDTALGPATFANEKTFQIRAPGLNNGRLGVGTSYPTGALVTGNPLALPYDDNQYDDVSNFTKGATFEDDLP